MTADSVFHGHSCLGQICLAVSRQIVQLYQFLNDSIGLATLDAFGNAHMEMVFQDDGFEFLDGLADRVGLTKNIYTVLIFLNHLADAFEMPLNVI